MSEQTKPRHWVPEDDLPFWRKQWHLTKLLWLEILVCLAFLVPMFALAVQYSHLDRADDAYEQTSSAVTRLMRIADR